MGKSKKDACGGHANRFIETRAGICGNSAHFRRFAKDRSNRLIRRQAKAINEQAMFDYYDDLEERRAFELEMQEYDMLMAEMYDPDDWWNDDDDDYHPTYEDEYEPDYWPGDYEFYDYPDPPVISKPFVYERDIESY